MKLRSGAMHFRFCLIFCLRITFLPAFAGNLSPLAPPPDWAEMAAWQETMTRADFVRLLESVYAPAGAAHGLIEVRDDHAEIVLAAGAPEIATLRFAKDAASAKAPPRYWRVAAELGPAPPERPLTGVRIALDPGHLGGAWARMEERWYRLGETTPVAEGDLTLRVAQRLEPLLAALGAEVSWVRHTPGPTTEARPADLRAPAREILEAQGAKQVSETYAGFDDPTRGSSVQFHSEVLFYRMSEIRHRATLVNRDLKPDLVLCLHLNAESWGDLNQPEFSPRNHLHLLVNGCYSAAEIRLDDVRLDLLARLLSGVTAPEQALADHVATAFARRAALPPLIYTGPNACRVNDNPYVWARNLLANRLYRCPVVFLEPYVMNNREVWERVQAGDYEGERAVAGTLRASIFREYAEGVAEGLARYYRQTRGKRGG
jgi:N-acetylmuramoyl-L-alanine amidase